jgi:Flp pilus assembly protein TadG
VRALQKLLSEENGVSLIETAVVISSTLVILFGIMEFSRAIYADIYIGYVAHAATRYAMVRGTTFTGTACSTTATQNCAATSTDVVNFAKSSAPLGIATATDMAVTPSWPGTGATGTACVTTNGAASPGCVVKVQVTYNFHFVLPLVSSNALLLKSVSAVTIVQ